MARAIRSDQCGVCSEIGSQRVEPRVLPCGHSLCKPCLSSDHIRIGHHRCPTCRTSFDGDIEELPESSETESQQQTESASSDAISTCRSCTYSGIEPDLTSEAVLYCMQCKRSFCDNHLQLHKRLLSNHHTVTIKDFTNSRPNQQTFCRKHESYLLIVGCNLCRGLFCNMCLIVNPNYCFKSPAQEKVHSFEVVEEIISKTRDSLRACIENLEEKSQEYGEITTLASQMQGQVENQNTQAINRLGQAKQAMIQNITVKFEILESQLNRNKSVLDQEIDDYATDIEKIKQQIDKTIDNLKQHADGCSEEELIMQIDDITVMVDEMLSWRQKNINCSQILTLQIGDESSDITSHLDLVSVDVSLQLSNGTLLEPGELKNSTLTAPSAPSPPPSFTALHPLQGSLSDLSDVRPPRPRAIVIVTSSMIYKGAKQPPPAMYSSIEGRLYLLSKGNLLCCAKLFESEARECLFDDSGEFIVAHNGNVFTRQALGPQLLRVYHAHNRATYLIENLHHSFVHSSHAHLINSFAAYDEYIIFCEDSSWQPKLFVIPQEGSDGFVREVPLMVEEGTFKCRYITAGPPGHVLIMCDQTTGLGYAEVLVLVKVSDGSVEWTYKCDRAREFAHDYNKLPQPVMYRRGYCYFTYDKTTIQVIDVVAGQLLRSFITPVKQMQGYKVVIKSMQMLPYGDDGVLIVSDVNRRHLHTGHTTCMVISTLWQIEYDS